MSGSPRILAMFLGAVGLVAPLACRGPASSGAAINASSVECVPVLHPSTISPADRRLDPVYIDSITPAVVFQRVESVLYAELIDLNCDGHLDYVGQVIGAADPTAEPRLAFVVFLRAGDQWTEALFSPSPVDGLETVVIAADLNSNGHLEIVSWGADEGGYIPRVFLSVASSYQPIPVPHRYTLRFEALWDVECRTRVQPSLVESHLQLTRETISPTDPIGHGSICDLPTDTLMVQGDSLSLVDGS
jgi:hypothetical protein